MHSFRNHAHRSPRSIRRLAPLSAAALLALSGGLAAEKITVGEAGIATIQDAVDLALANVDADDVILVPSGTYDESVVVDMAGTGQESLRIRGKGKGSNRPHVRGVGAGSALTLKDGHDVEIERLVLESAAPDDAVPAFLVTGSSADVIARDVSGVPGDDIGVVLLGVFVQGVLLDDCDFSGMLGAGFVLEGMGHELVGCAANACGENALVITDDGLLCRIEKFSAHSDGGINATRPGVVSLRGNGHLLEKVQVSGGGADGIHLLGSGHTVSKSDSDLNAGAGFRVEGSLVRIEKCSARGNLVGLSGGGLGTTIDKSKFLDNVGDGLELLKGGVTLRDVTSKKNGGHGVAVTAAALGTAVIDCRLKQNGGEGVMVQGQLAWLEENVSKKGDGLIDQGTNNAGRGNKVKGGDNDFE